MYVLEFFVGFSEVIKTNINPQNRDETGKILNSNCFIFEVISKTSN